MFEVRQRDGPVDLGGTQVAFNYEVKSFRRGVVDKTFVVGAIVIVGHFGLVLEASRYASNSFAGQSLGGISRLSWSDCSDNRFVFAFDGCSVVEKNGVQVRRFGWVC